MTRMFQRRGSASEWEDTNPVLGQGEIGYETDTGFVKVGDGSAAWNSLDYLASGGVGGSGGGLDKARIQIVSVAGQVVPGDGSWQSTTFTVTDFVEGTGLAREASGSGVEITTAGLYTVHVRFRLNGGDTEGIPLFVQLESTGPELGGSYTATGETRLDDETNINLTATDWLEAGSVLSVSMYALGADIELAQTRMKLVRIGTEGGSSGFAPARLYLKIDNVVLTNTDAVLPWTGLLDDQQEASEVGTALTWLEAEPAEIAVSESGLYMLSTALRIAPVAGQSPIDSPVYYWTLFDADGAEVGPGWYYVREVTPNVIVTDTHNAVFYVPADYTLSLVARGDASELSGQVTIARIG